MTFQDGDFLTPLQQEDNVIFLSVKKIILPGFSSLTIFLEDVIIVDLCERYWMNLSVFLSCNLFLSYLSRKFFLNAP